MTVWDELVQMLRRRCTLARWVARPLPQARAET